MFLSLARVVAVAVADGGWWVVGLEWSIACGVDIEHWGGCATLLTLQQGDCRWLAAAELDERV